MNDYIYSIGIGNKKIEVLIKEIKEYNIKYVIDIRSKPYSKYYPESNKENIEREIQQAGLVYVFLGKQLGGLPEDKSCYDIDGKINYSLLAKSELFKSGIERLINAYRKKIPVVLMCSEKAPKKCHRSKLIGRELSKNKIEMIHIIDSNTIKTQQEIMYDLTKGFSDKNLFGWEEQLTSRKQYKK